VRPRVALATIPMGAKSGWAHRGREAAEQVGPGEAIGDDVGPTRTVAFRHPLTGRIERVGSCDSVGCHDHGDFLDRNKGCGTRRAGASSKRHRGTLATAPDTSRSRVVTEPPAAGMHPVVGGGAALGRRCWVAGARRSCDGTPESPRSGRRSRDRSGRHCSRTPAGSSCTTSCSMPHAPTGFHPPARCRGLVRIAVAATRGLLDRRHRRLPDRAANRQVRQHRDGGAAAPTGAPGQW
jgi:hypothetical protein